jgi:hypothetical protein
MAAPAWAAKGNSANAKLCEPGGYPGALLAQDGSAFKTEGACTSYAAKGGQIAGVNATSGAVASGVFPASWSGFGLKPETEVFACLRYSSGTTLCVTHPELPKVAADGTFSASIGAEAPCEFAGSKVVNLFVQATTASGTFFERDFPVPCWLGPRGRVAGAMATWLTA